MTEELSEIFLNADINDTHIADTHNDAVTHSNSHKTEVIKPSYMKRFYSRDEIDYIKNHIEGFNVKRSDEPRALWVLSSSCIYLLCSFWMITVQFHIGVVLTACSYTRLFMIFHDACHNSFFYAPSDNQKLGLWLQYLFPWSYDQWRNTHGEHHTVFGNKAEEDPALTVITKAKYEGLENREKWLYRIFRDPLVFFWMMPFYFIVYSGHHKSIKGVIGAYSKYVICWMIGGRFLWGFGLSMYIAMIAGTVSFHLQHCINVGFSEASNHKNKYHMRNHALLGASMMRIPVALKWATLGIEYHHIHHFSTRVPSYKLRECHEEGLKKGNMWRKVPYVGYIGAIVNIFNVYYNEDNGRYEVFDEYKKTGEWIVNWIESMGWVKDITKSLEVGVVMF
jgi:acyl-lipid omega-6 desaturase (Delta-12 desaturase)